MVVPRSLAIPRGNLDFLLNLDSCAKYLCRSWQIQWMEETLLEQNA